MIFVCIILHHVKRLCYTPTLVYTTAILYVYVCYTHYDIWLCTIISHTTLIYYTITIIITIILIYFYFLFLLLCCCMCVCVCVYVLCCVVSLLCVYVCSLVCPRVCSYMCICVCLPRITLLGCAVVKRLMCWYRGGYISGKNFYKFWKMGIPGKNRPQEHFRFGKTVKTLDKTVQMCYNINIETKGDW